MLQIEVQSTVMDECTAQLNSQAKKWESVKASFAQELDETKARYDQARNTAAAIEVKLADFETKCKDPKK